MTYPKHPPGLLALENGFILEGLLFGAADDAAGEVCFNTSMSGYQEVLTDPSYCGQIVVMTAPHIGNYGINAEDVQSSKIQVAGFVVRDLCRRPSNWRSISSLHDYLADAGVTGITDVDTRALTRLLRTDGAKRGVIGPASAGADALIERARSLPEMAGQELASLVTTAAVRADDGEGRYRVAIYDFGVKQGIIDELRRRDFAVTVYPADTPAERVLADKPDCVLLSNGPGDPEVVTNGIDAAQKILGQLPLFGICLGHQILALACGARTYKLKFGHRGSNHPVREEATGRIMITAQNHGFAVDPESLPDTLEVTHLSCNDGTIEGISHRQFPAWSVQYHPEAAPGPHDSWYLFDRMVEELEKRSCHGAPTSNRS